jgi:hypothetical protein
MKTAILALSLVLASQSALAANHDPKAIAAMLGTAKVSLVEGITFAEKTSGVATSAKFEIDKGKLVLSIYTIPEGLGVEPEKATLTELVGNAADGTVGLKTHVFEDKEHIARSAVHMTLFQLSPMSLKQVIDQALSRQNGIVIDVRNPMIRNQRPVADVILVDDDGDDAYTVTVDLLNGKTTVKKQY